MSVWKPCFLVVVAAMLVAAVGQLSAQDSRSPEQRKKDQQAKTAELLAVVQSDAPMEKKAAALEELAIHGTSDTIPVVAPMLSDQKLSHYARYALEPIPDPAVDDVFRGAMGKVQGKMLIGVINSIGMRRDTRAVAALSARLGHADVGVSAAAAASLGKIANDQAVAALQKGLASGSKTHRAGIADGCLVCAETLLKQDKAPQAISLYDAVSEADVPTNLRMAGLRGAVLARESKGIDKLVEIIVESKTTDELHVALRCARELGGDDVAQALLDKLNALPPDRKALVILVLADLNCKKALPAVIEAARSKPRQLHIAALRALKSIGDASVVSQLWKDATGSDVMVSKVAREALVALRGEQVDAAIASRLKDADPVSKKLAIELAGQRRIVAALPILMKMVERSDEPLRLTAMAALGEILPLDQLPTLVQWVANARDTQEKEAAIEALKAACIRMPNADACADVLARSITSVPFETKVLVLEQLRIVRGSKSLQFLAKAAKDPDPKMQDEATRILGTWISPDAAPVLLDLAKTLKDNKYKIRALRGYVRFARQFGFPESERIAICRNALEVAQRNEERKLILDVLNRYPSIESLTLAATLLDNPKLKNDAARVVVTIGEKFAQDDPKTVAAAMQRILNGRFGAGLKQRAKRVLNRTTQTKQ